MNENPESILENLLKYHQAYEKHKLSLQVHERSILIDHDLNEENWPDFSVNLDKRLYYITHFIMEESLSLLKYKDYVHYAQRFLKKSAESLEYLYNSPKSKISEEVLLKSIFAYYISSNYANSYVLTMKLNETKLPIFLKLITNLLKKDFIEARYLTSKVFNNDVFEEQNILIALEKGAIDNEEAIFKIICYSVARVVSLFIEYMKTGDYNLFKKASFLLNASIKLSKEYHLVDTWWWLYCLSFIFKEYEKNSLWNCLKDFEKDADSQILVEKYIKNKLDKKPPQIELWPSQKKSLEMINDIERGSFCLNMPTSSGKTQIAELTILRFFIDHKDKIRSKCIYISPYKSLAVEIEETFQKSLGDLGFEVSELYGKFFLNPAEKTVIENTDILIMTPEKFDAIVRYMPELENTIGLIIIDEGHNIKQGKRGLMFEFFLQRLLNKYKNCRFVFISAVLPNAKDFTKWITGSEDQIVTSQWKPSRLLIGNLVWDKEKIDIEYTHIKNDGKLIELDHKWEVPKFIEKISYKGVPGLKKFPKTPPEALAFSSLKMAMKNTTLMFISQKKHVIEFADFLVDNVIPDLENINKSQNESFSLPINKNKEFINCKNNIISEMGHDAPLLKYLEKGFIIHHGSLPDTVRISIEDLIRSNGIKLIISTSTLAEGVNLPIKTVIVKEIHYRQNEYVDALTFWNICGRAGRAGKENEGNILFWLEPNTSKIKKNRIMNLIKKLDKSIVKSQIYEIIRKLALEWQRHHSNIEFIEMCEYIINNTHEWVSEDRKNEILKDIDIFDGHLLALMEESSDLSRPENLQEFLKNSLLFIQIEDRFSNFISKDLAEVFLESRISYINFNYSKATRSRFYKLGIRLSDCEKIEENSNNLIELFNKSESWLELSEEEQVEILIEISNIILKLEEFMEGRFKPPVWRKILNLWLKGFDTQYIYQKDNISDYFNDQNGLKLFLDDFCGYILPWGMNSVSNYLKYFEETHQYDIPQYFSGMIKYGILNPLSLWILPQVNYNRNYANELSNIYPYNPNRINKLDNWLKTFSIIGLVEKGFKKEDAEKIMGYLKSENIEDNKNFEYSIKITSNTNIAKKINLNDKVIVVPENKNVISVFTLDGKVIGKYKFKDEIPKMWFNLNRSNSFISKVKKDTDQNYLIKIVIKS